ncbi:MAG: transcription antitermination factor NusB [Candidatus Aminicenantes bacterium]|nr:transcription antitermination factor NusB [Candidatus Aminicenantes bacterium]
MGKRRSARERALQALYGLEFNEGGPDILPSPADAAASAAGSAPDAEAEYAAWLVRGVSSRRDELDGLIQATSRNWRVARMTPVDRNILRLAVLELLEEGKTVAPAIVINEAIEIAKRFSGEESADFVNGVLDAVRRSLADKESTTKVDDHEPRPKTERPEPKRPPVRIAGRGAAKRSGAGPGRKA